jgi:HEAT repeat protein
MGPAAASAVPALTEALRDKACIDRRGDQYFVCVAAAGALGEIGAAAGSAVGSLAALLRDEEPEVREAAARALGRLGPVAEAAIPALDEALQGRAGLVAVAGLGGIGPAAVPALLAAFREGDCNTRVATAWGLAQIGPAAQAAVAPLAEALEGEEPLVRVSAAAALWHIARHPAAVPALARALTLNPDAEVRFRAAQALEEIGQEAKAAVPALVRALRDEAVAYEAGRALAAIDPGAPAQAEGNHGR